jgi:hypothetical protein
MGNAPTLLGGATFVLDVDARTSGPQARADLNRRIFLMLQKRCLPGYPNLIVVSGFNARRMPVSVRLTSI